MFRKIAIGITLSCLFAAFVNSVSADDRTNVTKKGSLLVYPKVEIKWEQADCFPDMNPVEEQGCEYRVTQDTFLTIVNDFPGDVKVQYYFVNGDEPLDPVFCCDPQELVERGHPGWNWVDCQNILTDDQSIYWSALTGNPHGCQPFTVLDPGTPPGRPDTEEYAVPGSRILRGFVVAWAVNDSGEEIRWNHLSGSAMLINYNNGTAWEYGAYAYRALTSAPQGAASDGVPGQLLMNGEEYDMNYNMLVLDFFAFGSYAFEGGYGPPGEGGIKTDLTLMVMGLDLRQDNNGPITTKAKFDLWNSNEVRFSGTERCVTCWDQTLLGDYDAPNHFLYENLQTDKGKARIDGLGSTVCPLSQDAPLLGVEAKFVGYAQSLGGGYDNERLRLQGATASGSTMVGQGEDTTGFIRNDIIAAPEESNSGVNGGVSLGSLLAKPVRK